MTNNPPPGYFYSPQPNPYFNQYGQNIPNYNFQLPPIPQAPGLFGMGGARPSGPFDAAAQMFLPPLAQQLLGTGNNDVFNFGGQNNPVTTLNARQFRQQTNQAIQSGVQSDLKVYENVLRGMLYEADTPLDPTWNGGQLRFDKNTERAIGGFKNSLGQTLAMLAPMMPDTLDSITPRGSKAVAAINFADANRFIKDPVTGKTINESDPNFSTRVLDKLITSDDLTSTGGLGAGRVGDLYKSLVKSGKIDSGKDLKEKVDSGELSPDQAREIHADRIKDTLAKYSKSVGVIRDIFGDAGKPNAPMSELLKSLDHLTSGGMTFMDPAKLTQTARQMQAITQHTTVGLDELGQITTASQALVRQYGGNQQAATTAALRSVYAGENYAGKFDATGSQAVSKQDFMAYKLQADAATSGSEAANLIGAIDTLADMTEEGSELRQLRDRILSGDASAFEGLTTDDIVSKAEKSGISGDNALKQLQNEKQNKAAYAAKKEYTKTAAGLRAAEKKQNFMRYVNSDSGITEDDYDKLRKEAATGNYGNDVDMINALAKREGWDANKKAAINNVLSQMAENGLAPSGKVFLAEGSEEQEGDMTKTEGDLANKAADLEDATGKGRQGAAAGVAGALEKTGKGDIDNSGFKGLIRGAVQHVKLKNADSGKEGGPGAPGGPGGAGGGGPQSVKIELNGANIKIDTGNKTVNAAGEGSAVWGDGAGKT